MAKDHGLHEATGYYINVTPAQWHNFKWASDPHPNYVWELAQEDDDFGEVDPLKRPTARSLPDDTQPVCCDMYPDADTGFYLPFRDHRPTKYPKRVLLATLWCLEDFLYRIGTQLEDMTNDAFQCRDLTVGQYAAQMKSINNCVSKLFDAGRTNPKFNPNS
jgi:hypothetical protein